MNELNFHFPFEQNELGPKRSPSIGDDSDLRDVAARFVLLSLVNDSRKESLKKNDQMEDDEFYLEKLFIESFPKEMTFEKSMSLKKLSKNEENSDFDCRFMFYDKLVPIFDYLQLPNKVFFRMITFIEKCLLFRDFNSLRIYKQRSQESTNNLIVDEWLKMWYAIAIPCLLLAAEIEMSQVHFVHMRIQEYCTRISPELKDFVIDWGNMRHYETLFFFWNNGEMNPSLYTDVLSGILSKKRKYGSSLHSIRDVFEKTLILVICYSYELYLQNMDGLCEAVVCFCLTKIDKTFTEYAKDLDLMSEKDKLYVKEFRKDLKKLIKQNFKMESIIKEIENIFETIHDEGPSNRFYAWKYNIPEPKENVSKSKAESVIND